MMKEIKEALYILNFTYIVIGKEIFPDMTKMPFGYISPSSTVVELGEESIKIYNSAEKYAKSKDEIPSGSFSYAQVESVALTTTSLVDRTSIRNQYLTVIITTKEVSGSQKLYCTDFKVIPALKTLFFKHDIKVEDNLNLEKVSDWDNKRIDKYLYDVNGKDNK